MTRSMLCLAVLLAILAGMVRCAWGAECRIEWDHPPYHERVIRWEIWRGIERIATVYQPAALIDLPHDSRSTLSVFAINADGQSPPTTVTVIPWVPKFSENLTAWEPFPARTIFTDAAKPRLFASYSFPPK